MAYSTKQLIQIGRWLSLMVDSDSLEAPQRDFIGHRDIITRNLSRYHFIKRHIFGALLEIGCGRGYGLSVLGHRGPVHIGLDLAHKFLMDAKQENPRAAFACGSGDALPLASESFDTVIAFDVIEHARDAVEFLMELKRVARQGAFIAISTPNRLISSGGRVSPLNPFHVREYLASEFYDLLRCNFLSLELFGQFDQESKGLSRNKLLDRIPIHWKYKLPHGIQSLLSVAIRPPLRLEDCQFRKTDIERAHTFVALCRT